MKDAKTAYFLTLTYDDEHLPKTKNGNPTLVKEDLYSFLHELVNEGQRLWQEKLKKDGLKWKERKKMRLPIRYFAVGEYGDEEDRPHYHIALFNFPADKKGMANAIANLWQKEQLIPSVLYCSGRLINYLTKYMLKQYEEDSKTDRQSPFRSMSKGMGKNYCTTSRAKQHVVADDFRSNIGNAKYVLPRYLKTKLLQAFFSKYHNIDKDDKDFYLSLGADNYRRAKEFANAVNVRAWRSGYTSRLLDDTEKLLVQRERKIAEAKKLNY